MCGKHGRNDAAVALGEIVGRPSMRFVPVKEEHHRIILALLRSGA